MTKRWKDGGVDKVAQWVVESSYLHPPGTTAGPARIAFPDPPDLRDVPAGKQPFRYLGRSVPLQDYHATALPQDEYLREPLTAIGYGDPSFAAFYPNCRGVFGFFDSAIGMPLPQDLSYEVMGWYADPSHDHLRSQIERAQAAQAADAVEGALSVLGWQASGTPASGAILLLVCHARLTFAEAGGETTQPPTAAEVTFGNTTAEALSAYLASIAEEEGLGKKSEIEDQLEAVLLSSRLDSRETDIGVKFEEARHARAFRSAPPDFLWAIRPGDAARNADAAPVEWPDAASLLDELNDLQREYNGVRREIRQRRGQLAADWHKYMACAHAPDGGAADYPNPDEVLQFIVRSELPPLERLLSRTGRLVPAPGGRPEEVVASRDSSPESLAARVIAKKTEVQECLDKHQTSGSAVFLLQRYAAPRFFRPTDPVLLLTGEAVRVTDRYSRGAAPSGKDGRLPCAWIEPGASVSERPGDVAAAITRAGKWSSRAWTKPWHPFRMDWDVELRPLARADDADFVVRKYTLRATDVDLKTRSTDAALTQHPLVYRGSSLLTPHGVDVYLAALREELRRGGLPSLRPVDPDAVPGGDIIDDETDTPKYPYLSRVSKAARTLRTLAAMAQSLSGFNDALLMNLQTLQLPIDDPIGFPRERSIAARVRAAMGDGVHRSPLPANSFVPIRTGELRLRWLRIIDTFGQWLDVDGVNVKCRSARTLPQSNGAAVMLPPRLVQPARLSFRWQAADSSFTETHAHPDTTPICGWLLLNHADRNLFVYAADGQALGYLEVERERVCWRTAPGREQPVGPADISNTALGRLVRFFLSGSGEYFDVFLGDMEAAQDFIEPEDPGEALLMGRPLALVRASLAVELDGPPAVHQGWHQLIADMRRDRRSSGVFPSIRFPIRLGDKHQLGDGLTIYFPEDEHGGYDAYVIPDYSNPGDPSVDPRLRKCDFLYRSADAGPLMVTMLVDPRGNVHATTGILPVKSIGIPSRYYEDALRRIEMSFLAAPVLAELGDGGDGEISLPLAHPPGRTWVFVEKQDGAFQPPRRLRAAPLHLPFAAPSAALEGWLRLTQQPPREY